MLSQFQSTMPCIMHGSRM